MKQQSRRDFLKNGLLATSAVALLPNALLAAHDGPNHKHIGVQLWSVKDDMKADAKGTLAKLAKMGYKEVEGFGYDNGKFFGYTPSELAKALAENGLKMPSFHGMITSKDYEGGVLSERFKKMAQDCKAVGVETIFCPWMDTEDRPKARLMALIYNKAGAYCKTLGMRFGYHNHDFEFKEFNEGEMLYKTLLEHTDKNLVDFEMDLYWVEHAKESPVEWFKKYPGRFTYFHVKDHDPVKNVSVEVGEGDINFQKIFDSKLSGAKHFVVELEAYKRTPLEGVEIGLKNLKKLKF